MSGEEIWMFQFIPAAEVRAPVQDAEVADTCNIFQNNFRKFMQNYLYKVPCGIFDIICTNDIGLV